MPVEEGLVVTLKGDADSLEKAASLGERSMKRFNTSAEKTGQALSKMSVKSNGAGQAVLDLSRIASDAPYGFMAISNNIEQALGSFGRLREQTGGVGSALKALGSSMIGPAGIGLAFSIASSLAIKYGDRLYDLIGISHKAKASFADVFINAAKGSGDDMVKLEVLRQKLNDMSIPVEQRTKLIKEYNAVADKTNEIDAKQVNNLTLINAQIGKQNQLIQQRALSTAALSKLTEASNKQIEMELELQEALNASGLSREEVAKAAEAQLQRQMQQSQSVRKGLDGMAQSYQNLQQPIKQTGSSTKVVSSALISLFNKVQMGKNDFDRLTDSLKGFITVDGLSTKGVQDKLGKQGKVNVNFFDQFFDFDYNSSKLSSKQKEALLGAARGFEKEFGSSLKGLDFYKATDEASLDAAKAWWANFQKGMVQFKPKAFLAVPDFAKDIPKIIERQSIADNFNETLKKQFEGKKLNLGILDNPEDIQQQILFKYQTLLSKLGATLPKTISIDGVEVDIKDIKASANTNKQLDEGLKEFEANVKASMQNVYAAINSMGTGAFESVGEALGQVLSTGDLSNGISTITSFLGESIDKIGKALIQYGTVKSGLDTIIAQGFYLPGGAAIAAGVAALAAGAMVKNLKVNAFAAGGLAFGPALGLVGEGVGTSASNPEVIAPLDKLKQFINPSNGGSIQVTGRLRGNDMVLQNSRTGRKQRRVR